MITALSISAALLLLPLLTLANYRIAIINDSPYPATIEALDSNRAGFQKRGDMWIDNVKISPGSHFTVPANGGVTHLTLSQEWDITAVAFTILEHTHLCQLKFQSSLEKQMGDCRFIDLTHETATLY